MAMPSYLSSSINFGKFLAMQYFCLAGCLSYCLNDSKCFLQKQYMGSECIRTISGEQGRFDSEGDKERDH